MRARGSPWSAHDGTTAGKSSMRTFPSRGMRDTGTRQSPEASQNKVAHRREMLVVDVPAGYEPVKPPLLSGGSKADHEELLRLYYRFRVVNDALDGEALRELWSRDPANVFFNSNGHTYYGLEDWLKIW